MKKIVLLTLVLAMVFSMTACCNHHWEPATCQSPEVCNDCGSTQGEALAHTAGELTITSVDTASLTINYALPCTSCGVELETKTSPTGIAPVNSATVLTPQEWYDCFTTNTQLLGAGQVLIPHPVASDDGAVLNSLVSTSGMTAVFSYHDADGNVITSDTQDTRGLVHNICVESQFTNDSAQHFYMMLMIILINNNASLDYAVSNTLAAQIMTGNVATDNGYTYAMEIVSAEDHTVRVSITAE